MGKPVKRAEQGEFWEENIGYNKALTDMNKWIDEAPLLTVLSKFTKHSPEEWMEAVQDIRSLIKEEL